MKKKFDCPLALYVPNILGYARIYLALYGLSQCIVDPAKTAALFFFSGILDMFDGPLARRLNQCSKFGVLVRINWWDFRDEFDLMNIGVTISWRHTGSCQRKLTFPVFILQFLDNKHPSTFWSWEAINLMTILLLLHWVLNCVKLLSAAHWPSICMYPC